MSHTPPIINSFGRRKGRRIRSPHYEGLLPHYRWHADLLTQQAWTHIVLDIGFGAGEVLHHKSGIDPTTLHIGCEPFQNAIANLLQRLSKEPRENLCIFPDDARLLLPLLPAHSIHHIDILFPDPWPKARHAKRRLVQPAFLQQVAELLEPGASLFIATDHADYAQWARAQFVGLPYRVTQHHDFPYIPTRYMQKALAGSRVYCIESRYIPDA